MIWKDDLLGEYMSSCINIKSKNNSAFTISENEIKAEVSAEDELLKYNKGEEVKPNFIQKIKHKFKSEKN